MYSDYRERHVTVAGLRPGDVLEYRTTTLITTPLATGEFWYEHRFPTHIAIMKARLEVDVPKTRELKLKSPNRKYTTTETGERRTYSWAVENIVPDGKDRNQADADEEADDSDDETPDVQLTTFKDWQQVARWYAKLQGERVVVDDSIRKKAAELTAVQSRRRKKPKGSITMWPKIYATSVCLLAWAGTSRTPLRK